MYRIVYLKLVFTYKLEQITNVLLTAVTYSLPFRSMDWRTETHYLGRITMAHLGYLTEYFRIFV